jgi:hypothetical protein
MTKKGKKHKEDSNKSFMEEPAIPPGENLAQKGDRKKAKAKGADHAAGVAGIKPKKLKAVTSVHIALLPVGSAARASFDPATGCLEFGIPLTLEIHNPKDDLGQGAAQGQDNSPPAGGAGPKQD